MLRTNILLLCTNTYQANEDYIFANLFLVEHFFDSRQGAGGFQ